MNPETNTNDAVLLVGALIAWTMVLWPTARARIDTYFAARRAARAARTPKTNTWRNRWH
jgi:hypothetical protein